MSGRGFDALLAHEAAKLEKSETYWKGREDGRTAERTRIASAIEALHYDAPAARIAQATAARIARGGSL